MELHTKELVLRSLSESDISEIAVMWRYPETLSTDAARAVLENMERRHAQNRVHAIFHLCLGVFLKEEPGKIIGWCGWDGRSSKTRIEMFYKIAAAYRGRGYATQCAVALLRYAFEEMKYDIVYSSCAKENLASFRVMEKAGMRQREVFDDGGFGFYMDREMFSHSK